MALIDLFTINPQDASVTYLAAIFGPLIQGAPAGIYIVPQLLKGLTQAVIIVAVLVIIYMVVVGTMMSAREGEFMKKWHGIWGPIRAVFGFALLVPSPATGYTILQYFVMYVIMQGIGFADYTWNAAAAIRMTGMAGPISLPTSEIRAKLGILYQGLVCEATSRLKYTYPVTCTPTDQTTCKYGTNKGYYCASDDYSSSEYCRNTLTNIPDSRTGGDTFSSNTTNAAAFNNTNLYSLGPHADCGHMIHCNVGDPSGPCRPGNTDSIECIACQMQVQAFTNPGTGILDPDHGLPAYARTYAELDYEYQNYWYQTQQVEADIQNWINTMAACANRNNPTPAPSGGNLPPSTSTEGGNSSNPTVPGGGNTPPPSCTARPPDLPPIPDWIQAYCDRHGIPRTAHCDSTNLPEPLPSTAGVNKDIVQSIYAGGVASVAQKEFHLNLNDPNFLDTFVNTYVNTLSGAVSAYIQATARALVRNNNDYTVKGWLFGGAYFYYLARMDSNNLSKIWPVLEVEAHDPAATNPQIYLARYLNNYTAAANLSNLASNSPNASASSGTGVAGFPGGDAAANSLSDAGRSMSSAMSSAASDIASGVSPLFAISHAGQALLISVEVIWTAFFIATTILGMVGGLSVFGLGSGVVNPTDPAQFLIYMILVPAIYLMLGVMLSIGATLAVYIPLVPFIIYSFGALGWFVSVIEAVIAAPFVALGILLPGGDEVLGRSEQAVTMLLSTALRPGLMVIGLWAGNELSKGVLKFLQDAFWNNNYGVFSVLVAGDPLTTIIFTAAYIGLLAIAVNKIFAIIYIVPDRVLTWMGAQAGQGETGAEAISETKGAVAGAADKTSGITKGQADRVGEVGHKQAKHRKGDKTGANLQPKK